MEATGREEGMHPLLACKDTKCCSSCVMTDDTGVTVYEGCSSCPRTEDTMGVIVRNSFTTSRSTCELRLVVKELLTKV